MKLPGRGTLVLDAASIAVLAWLYGGDLIEYRRALSAEVAAIPALPNAAFAVAALAATAIAVGVAGWGIVTSRPANFRGYRLLPIVLVVALFIDLFIVSTSHSPAFPPGEQLGGQMSQLAQSIQLRSTGRRVLADPRELGALVEKLGEPPYRVHGHRPAAYGLQVRTGCDGPVSSAPGAAVGTVLYCVSPDEAKAWLTVVALPAGQLFGTPDVFSASGTAFSWAIRPLPTEVAQEPDTPWDAGTP